MDFKCPFLFLLLLPFHLFLLDSLFTVSLPHFICKLSGFNISAVAAVVLCPEFHVLSYLSTLQTPLTLWARAGPSFCLVVFANCLEAIGHSTLREQVLLRHPLLALHVPPRAGAASPKTDTCWLLPSACFVKRPRWHLPLVLNLAFSGVCSLSLAVCVCVCVSLS